MPGGIIAKVGTICQIIRYSSSTRCHANKSAPVVPEQAFATIMQAAGSTVARHNCHQTSGSAPRTRPTRRNKRGQRSHVPLERQVLLTPGSFTDSRHQRPCFSYAQLIGMSLRSEPSGQLTISQIYRWISENFTLLRVLR
jgi:hypothetical protein